MQVKTDGGVDNISKLTHGQKRTCSTLKAFIYIFMISLLEHFQLKVSVPTVRYGLPSKLAIIGPINVRKGNLVNIVYIVPFVFLTAFLLVCV